MNNLAGDELPELGDHSIVLFDGVCNLCAGWVRFVLRRDQDRHFLFSALQSNAAKRLLPEHLKTEGPPTTVVLIDEHGRCFTKSDAALGIMRRLGGLWRLGGLLMVVPRPIRDWVYLKVARNRYRWFGRTDACLVPTKEFTDRFLH